MKSRRDILDGVGVLFWTKSTGRSLYLLRRDGYWSLPGGKVEGDETLISALHRECREEIGWWGGDKLYPVECWTTRDGRFRYHTFFSVTPEEFIPHLNHEHTGWAWCDRRSYPQPLHRGLNNTLRDGMIEQKIDIILAHENLGQKNAPV